MGKYDSSLTRVRPVFSALYDQDASGEPWLGRLLHLAVSPCGREPAAVLPDLGQLACPPQFEFPVDPPKSYLAWLLHHPDCLCRPAETEWVKWSKRAQQKRGALLAGDLAIRDEALAELEQHPSLGRRVWWRLEGITYVDCALLTPTTAVFIEGKRTERGPSKQVCWYQGRNQVLRILDCAAAFAQQTKLPSFFVMLIVERDLVAHDPARQAEIEAITSPGVVRDSLPHLVDEERAALVSRYLGVTTWQDIVETFGLDSSVLLDRVEC